jgi:hypothetical protein
LQVQIHFNLEADYIHPFLSSAVSPDLISTIKMAANRPPGRSLYASLIDPNASSTSTITSDPVIYKQKEADEAAAKIEAARKQISAGT